MIRRSLAIAFADKVTGILLTITTMAVVSRLLSPAQIGLYMVASAVVILIEAFRDFGLVVCIVQAPVLSRKLVQTAFTIMALLSIVLGLGILLAANWLAWFYAAPGLTGLIRVVALGFFLAPFGNTILALMRRDMAFGAIARISILAAITNAGVSIGLASNGYGAVSLAWGSVMAGVMSAIGGLISRPDLRVFRPSLSHWREVLPFGAWTTVITLLSLLFESFPRLILGRILGFHAVGLMARSTSLTQLPERLILSAVQPVVLPALAARARAKTPLTEPFLTGLSHITALQWPALAVLAVLAGPVVALLLGPHWQATVPLVRIAALASFCVAPGYLVFPVLVSVGRVREMAMSSLIALPPSMAIVFVAAHFGLTAVACSLFLTGPLQMFVGLHFVRRHAAFHWSDLAAIARRAALITLCTVPAPLLLLALRAVGVAPTTGDFLLRFGVALLALVGAGIGWWGGLRLVRHPLADEIVGACAGALRAGQCLWLRLT